MASAPYAPFNNVPPEILLNILAHIPTDRQTSVQLVSKVFSTYTKAVFRHTKPGDRDFANWCQCHTQIEASLPRGRPLNCCICTHCGRVQDRIFFTDTQARKDNPRRICISCGINRKKYTEKVLPRINGQHFIPCWNCKKAVPQFKHWRVILSLARHQFQIPPSADAAEIYSIQYGAYCQTCLEEKTGDPLSKLYAKITPRSGARRSGLVTMEGGSLKDVIKHGVTLGNGPGFFKLG